MSQTFVTFKIEGIEPLAGFFEKFPAKVQNAILREALRPAAKVIQQNVIRGTPVGPSSYWKGPKGRGKLHHGGDLRKSIKVKAAKRSRVSVGVNVVTGATDNVFVGDQFYGAFVEFGHFMGKRKRSAPRRGDEDAWAQQWAAGIDPTGAGRTRKIPGEHFMQHRAEEKIPEVTRMISTSITNSIEQIASAAGMR